MADLRRNAAAQESAAAMAFPLTEQKSAPEECFRQAFRDVADDCNYSRSHLRSEASPTGEWGGHLLAGLELSMNVLRGLSFFWRKCTHVLVGCVGVGIRGGGDYAQSHVARGAHGVVARK